ncbi:hypothetical protein BDL97_09G063200 [Sphagnum fallax]|nr:hypothetical protein BDL97_09G063200 [Sphagnum fallax]
MGRGRGPNTADSFIGSLISLTSKSEIRYEGILYTVDTDNSNIALQNVRSFGTEGRKKDGPQIPASDKIYDYIIFRGSDIKDLQVKSSPQLQPQTLPQPPTDPAIISLQQSQSQYLPPSSLGSYVGGIRSAGSSSEANVPPYSGFPPVYRGGMPSLYPSPGSWGTPPPPPPGPNGTGLAMPQYWQSYYRSPNGHLQQQPMPPQPPPSLASPSLSQPQPMHMPQQLQPVARPPGLVSVSPAAPATSTVQPQAPDNVSGISVSVPAALTAPITPTAPMALRVPVVPAAPAAPASASAPIVPVAPVASAVLATPAALAAPAPTAALVSVAASPTVSSSLAPVLSATTTLNIATKATPSCSAPVLSVPLSPATSLPSSLQGGVSAVITPAAKNPRRMLGLAYQSAQPSAQQTVENSSTQSPLMTGVPSAVASVQSHTATTQLTGVLAAPSKAHPSSSQQAPVKLEQKSDEPAKLAGQSITSTAEPPQQQQVTQPLLPLPQSQQKQPPLQRRGGHGVPVGQRNRWQSVQGNGATGNNNHTRRGRGRGSGSGRGIGLAHHTQQFTEDFDFTAMNEKFNKDEVWGELGGKSEKGGDEEDDTDGSLDIDTSGVAFLNKPLSEAPKKVMYVKDDFFDSLSCDALDWEDGHSERTKFSEQRKIDTETFGNFPLWSRGGRGGRGGSHRGGYRNSYGGAYGGGRGAGYGRARGTAQSTTAIK